MTFSMSIHKELEQGQTIVQILEYSEQDHSFLPILEDLEQYQYFSIQGKVTHTYQGHSLSQILEYLKQSHSFLLILDDLKRGHDILLILKYSDQGHSLLPIIKDFEQGHPILLKIHKYVYLCIFRLTTSRSRKLIPKADLKWECPYFYSKFFFEEFRSIFKKAKKWIFHCIFKKWFDLGRVLFFTKKWSVNPNTLEYTQVWLVACRKLKSNSARLKGPPLLRICSRVTLSYQYLSIKTKDAHSY